MEERRTKPEEAIKGWVSSLSTRLKVAAKVSALRFQINQLAAKRRDVLRQVGEKVYELYKLEKVGNPDVLELCKQIEGIDEEISQREREIERIRAEAGLAEGGGAEEAVSEEPLEKREEGEGERGP